MASSLVVLRWQQMTTLVWQSLLLTQIPVEEKLTADG